MTPDASPRAALEPAASLTSVRVKRRKLPVAPSGKPGDLTEGGAGQPEPEPTAAREVIVLPPPPPLAPQLREMALPFAEVLLPEVIAACEATEDATEDATESADVIALLPQLLLPEMPVPGRALAPIQPEPPAAAPQPELPLLSLELELEPEPEQLPLDATLPAFLEPPAEPPEAESGEDILDYWDGLRGTRAFPALEDLDRAHIAATWPNTVLVAVEPSELPRITRFGENDGEIEYTAGVIDWIMARGRNSAKRGEPMEEEKRFAISAGGARYRLLLLPVGKDGQKSDHVLCQLSRSEELSAVASFRRWLTG